MFARGLLLPVAVAALIAAPFAEAKSAKEIFAAAAGGVVVVLIESASGAQIGQGSGVVVGENEAATNCHVMRGAAKNFARQAASVRGREFAFFAKMT
jgi:hypothetical protein